MTTSPDTAVLRGIKLLLTDVDGVLTDGHIHFDGAGHELKTFHVHDGAGFVYWHRSGGLSGFVSGRGSKVVRARAAELGVHEVHLGNMNKLPILHDILERRALDASEVAYVGDDIADLPVLGAVGFAVTVANARQDVLGRVHYVTQAPGGKGALREVIELILKAQGKWDDIVRRSGLS